MEIWKNIEGYPNYQVSNMGRVKSLNYNLTGKEKILKSGKDRGYLKVTLWKEGKGKNYSIHRLVAQAFLDNHNNLPEVNHKDEDKSNNCVNNLEWCDRKYNTNYGTRNKRIQKPVLQFTKEGGFIRKWFCARDVERELEINPTHISSCCKGKKKSAGGFIWMYAVINGFEIDINKLKKVA